MEKGVSGIGRCCTVNPFAGHEHDWKVAPVSTKKRVLVVGGGASGMQAAIVACGRGHEVELWERSDKLGGQLLLASIAPHKEEVSEALRYLKHCLGNTAVRVRLETEAQVETVLSWEPDVVIVATGTQAGRLPVPGAHAGNLVDVRTVYRQGGVSGHDVVIIGGGDTGCETAEWLSDKGHQVTVLEMLPEVLPKMRKIPKERLLLRLSKKGVRIMTDSKATSIESGSVCVTQKNGQACTPPADTVIVAIHPERENRLLKALEGKVKMLIAVGDVAEPGNIGTALKSATEAALTI